MEDFKIHMHEKIKSALNENKLQFIIYPFGVRGRIFKQILNKDYGIKEIAVIDEKVKCENINNIKLNQLNTGIYKECYIFVVSDHSGIWYELRENLLKYVPAFRIIDVFPQIETKIIEKIVSGDKINVLFNPVINVKSNNMDSVGGNTGNLVFAESIKETYAFDLESSLSNYWIELGRRNVYAIWAAANFISPYATWIENFIPILEKTKMNITFAGLGAQGDLDECPQDVVNSLSDKQIYFFKMVSERAKSIGVRGEYTADCLEKMGIKNIDIIGCPSIFSCKAPYVVSRQEGGGVLYTADISKERIYLLAKQINAELIRQSYSDGEEESRIFFDFHRWNEYIQKRKYSFAFGSRFHGNMMALRNGVPTLWITHDWRTLELVRYLNLPYLNYYGKKFRNIRYAEELIEYVDYSNLCHIYPKLLKKYNDFINLNLSLL